MVFLTPQLAFLGFQRLVVQTPDSLQCGEDELSWWPGPGWQGGGLWGCGACRQGRPSSLTDRLLQRQLVGSGAQSCTTRPREPGAGSRGAEGGGRAEAGEVPTRSVSAGATPLHQLVL